MNNFRNNNMSSFVDSEIIWINKMSVNKDLTSRLAIYSYSESSDSESSFIIDYLLYKYIVGAAMCLPLVPTVLNLFLCHYEKEWLENCPIQFKPVIYKGYSDDIFVLFLSKEHLNLL